MYPQFRAATDSSQLNVVIFTKRTRRSYRLQDSRMLLDIPPSYTKYLPLYVPGWRNTPSDEAARVLVTSLLAKHPVVLVLDTTVTFGRGYAAAAGSVSTVASAIRGLLARLEKAGLPPERIHVVGFSLGAHAAGEAGRQLSDAGKPKLGRITALDPARPCFSGSQAMRLGKSDANFVHVLHTSAGILGLRRPLGHVDVYSDNRYSGCDNSRNPLECEHAQAWRLFARSVLDSRVLIGKQCENWEDLRYGRCAGNETTLGYTCSISARGLYRLMPPKHQKSIYTITGF